MTLFVELHLIQNFAPSNLNRDDTGAPKDALFGGQRRARVSSQCFKRAIRRYSRDQQLIPPENCSLRTKKLRDVLLERLDHRDQEESASKIEAALAAAGLKIKDDGKTEYQLFLGEREIAGIAALIEVHWEALFITEIDDKKSKKEIKTVIPPELARQVKALLDGGKAVDVALFGRMLADLPQVNQDAACQVAHAISTHRVERDFDYFTAIDDVGDPAGTGAGMIGQIEFNSATLYRYAVLDVGKLLANLQHDKALTVSAIEAFIQSMVRAIPSGKQNSFAAHNLPEFIGVSLRKSPLNLANAFERPVQPLHDQSLTSQSVAALSGYARKLTPVYGDADDRWAHIDLTGKWQQENSQSCCSVSDLIAWVRDVILTQWRD